MKSPPFLVKFRTASNLEANAPLFIEQRKPSASANFLPSLSLEEQAPEVPF